MRAANDPAAPDAGAGEDADAARCQPCWRFREAMRPSEPVHYVRSARTLRTRRTDHFQEKELQAEAGVVEGADVGRWVGVVGEEA